MSGKANRKHGGTKRSQSQQRYTAERRWERNKTRRVAKDAAWKTWCSRVRAKAEGVVKDMGRQVRKMRRAA